MKEHIAGIRIDVRDGTYRFSRLRIAPIQKPSGGYRIIAIPTVRDRLLQRTLLAHLEDSARFTASSTISFGFTKGRSLILAHKRALELRQAHPWVLQADIVKFFDQIPRPAIKFLVRRRVRSQVISDLLCRSVDCELEDGGGRGAEIAQMSGIQKGLGLRQGMPVSPLLSNLLLKGFDDALAKRKIPAIRYADDIAVFGDSDRECRDHLQFIRDTLAELRLRIPDLEKGGKTSISGPSEPVEFLGIEIKRFADIYKLCAPFKKITKIDEAMAEMASIPKCIEKKMNIGQLVRALDAFVAGHNGSMLAIDNRDDFISRLEAAKQKHLRRVLVDLIGAAAVGALNDEGLSLLGLKPFMNRN